LRRLSPAYALALLILNACGSSGGVATATLGADAIYTAAYHTLSAQQALQPGQTPTPTNISPTLLPGTQPPSSGVPTVSAAPTLGSSGNVGCDNSIFISDVTIPDGTVMAGGAKFVKTWSLQNSGTCAWTTGYKLYFASGDKMGGTYVSVGSPVQPGQQTEVSANLVAPTAQGTYRGTWRMQNEAGQSFGDFPYVQIIVGTASACRRSSRTQVTIAGDVGPENVTIDYGDGTVVSDLQGKYSITVPAGWSGTVTPISGPKVHPWTFSPAHRTYSGLNCDLLHEKFIATAPPGT
jgi:hypothetical protein